MAKGTKTGGGSRKGSPNKGTQELRDMILTALDRAGGVKYLEAQARDTPASFQATGYRGTVVVMDETDRLL